jgi:hypothetical protein
MARRSELGHQFVGEVPDELAARCAASAATRWRTVWAASEEFAP